MKSRRAPIVEMHENRLEATCCLTMDHLEEHWKGAPAGLAD
jgi:hypothetical protein